MGGEHFLPLPRVDPLGGSPPHGRGTPSSVLIGRCSTWLTPAWAGNTAATIPTRRSPRAHPRMGGEHPEGMAWAEDYEGSPPHGRGTPAHLPCYVPLPGLTPAWAGNTGVLTFTCPADGAHPRMGGEHHSSAAAAATGGGSPPHGRGTRRPQRRPRRRHGLTPAWAGNTWTCSAPSPAASAHPRMGGEHRLPAIGPIWRPGSPPHGRGTRGAVHVAPGDHGLTPAWAGNTAASTAARRRGRAHPRMGGEHLTSVPVAEISMGSPPHGRGTHVVGLVQGEMVGLTPAWAGNTSGSPTRSTWSWAHPRMGGEHASVDAAGVATAGSPPHGRGTRRARPGAPPGAGLTPAWAGNTEPAVAGEAEIGAHPRMGGEHRWRAAAAV